MPTTVVFVVNWDSSGIAAGNEHRFLSLGSWATPGSKQKLRQALERQDPISFQDTENREEGQTAEWSGGHGVSPFSPRVPPLRMCVLGRGQSDWSHGDLGLTSSSRGGWRPWDSHADPGGRPLLEEEGVKRVPAGNQSRCLSATSSVSQSL